MAMKRGWKGLRQGKTAYPSAPGSACSVLSVRWWWKISFCLCIPDGFSVGCVSAQIVSASGRGDSPGEVSKINEGTASVGGKGGAGNGR